jgi:hypothetical protein
LDGLVACDAVTGTLNKKNLMARKRIIPAEKKPTLKAGIPRCLTRHDITYRQRALNSTRFHGSSALFPTFEGAFTLGAINDISTIEAEPQSAHLYRNFDRCYPVTGASKFRPGAYSPFRIMRRRQKTL